MMKKMLVVLMLLCAHNAFSDAVSEKLQNKLNAISTMTAKFNQVVKAKKREVSRSSGSMALARPGRFRWETKNPMEQLIIADGNRLWVYDVDLEQVTVKKQKKGLGGTAALFLSGYDNTVTRDFDVTVSKKGSKEIYDLHAKSKKENFQRVKLIFTGDILVGLELFDQLGQRTDVNLSNIKSNPELSASIFKFKRPKGVDLVEQ